MNTIIDNQGTLVNIPLKIDGKKVMRFISLILAVKLIITF